MRTRRPLIVTLVALFHALNAGFMLVVFAVVAQSEGLPTGGTIITPGVVEVAVEMVVPPAHRRYHQRLRVKTFDREDEVFLLLDALLSTLIGFGLWFLLNWARRLVLLDSGIWLGRWIIGVMFSSVTGLRLASALSAEYVTLGLINAAIVWYMLEPDTKQAFGEDNL